MYTLVSNYIAHQSKKPISASLPKQSFPKPNGQFLVYCKDDDDSQLSYSRRTNSLRHVSHTPRVTDQPDEPEGQTPSPSCHSLPTS